MPRARAHVINLLDQHHRNLDRLAELEMLIAEVCQCKSYILNRKLTYHGRLANRSTHLLLRPLNQKKRKDLNRNL